MRKSLQTFGLVVRDFPRVIRTPPLSFEAAAAELRERLRDREANFLKSVEQSVFNHPRSPYLPLLKRAGCGLEDIRRTVQQSGLESALRSLSDAGVFVTFEEFKGRCPIVRDGREFPVTPADFDNPFLSGHYEGRTGGTTGSPTKTPINFARQAAQAAQYGVAARAYGIEGAPTALWAGILPDAMGLGTMIRLTLSGAIPERWFSPIRGRDLQLSVLKTDVATSAIVMLGRLAGRSLPWPEFVPIDRADIVANWAAETIASRGRCAIFTHVSRGLRLCLAAAERGMQLDGLTLIIGGEPATAAKVKQITATGARCFPGYSFSEAGGRVAMGCARPDGPSDHHLNTDTFAVISRSRVAPVANVEVPALYFTTLLPTAPKILLNASNDDYGIVETRPCGCLFEQIGLTEHLREIRSFNKLTGEGVTLVGSEMTSVLEEVLPGRFGGSALDYQLLEEEDERGFTRVILLVSPRVHIRDEAAVIEAMWEAFRTMNVGADQARHLWQGAGTLRIRRADPIWTARGKLMPMHLASRSVPMDR